jgi:hypothetical protein
MNSEENNLTAALAALVGVPILLTYGGPTVRQSYGVGSSCLLAYRR